MSFDEIMAELSKLTPEQRQLLRVRLAELDGENWMDDGELSPAEMKLIEERIAEYERNPEAGVSLEEMEKRLRAKLG